MAISVRESYRSLFTVSSEAAFFVLGHLLLMIMTLCGISCSLFAPTEMPDKVTMSGHAGPFVQGQKFEMQCDVFNVAPVKKLSVHWYKGSMIFSTQTFDNPSVSPVNASSVVTVLADGGDHGRLIWCEASMDLWLGTDHPANQSQAYKMEVLCMSLMSSYLTHAVLSCLFICLVVFE